MIGPAGHGWTIDLNADVGERPDALLNGSEEALLRIVTSANVACGGHAGDEATMAATLAMAVRLGVAAGAHPGYPDRAGFGRASLSLALADVEESVLEQVRALAGVAAAVRCELRHVKPHGALYNDAARDPAIAAAIARGVARFSRSVALVGLAGSAMLEAFADEGFAAVGEGFADRAYEGDGSLRWRALPGALITDPERAAAQALSIARDGRATAFDGSGVEVRAGTLCVHSDTPDAALIAAAVREALAANGVRVEPIHPQPSPRVAPA